MQTMAYQRRKRNEEVTSLDDEHAQIFTPINMEDGQPASYDGFIRIELSQEPVPYHVVKISPEHLDKAHCLRWPLPHAEWGY